MSAPRPRSTVTDLYDAAQWAEIPGLGAKTAQIIVSVLRRRRAIADNSPNGEIARLEVRIDKLWGMIFSRPKQPYQFAEGKPHLNIQQRVELLESEMSMLISRLTNDGWPRD